MGVGGGGSGGICGIGSGVWLTRAVPDPHRAGLRAVERIADGGCDGVGEGPMGARNL